MKHLILISLLFSAPAFAKNPRIYMYERTFTAPPSLVAKFQNEVICDEIATARNIATHNTVEINNWERIGHYTFCSIQLMGVSK